MKKKIVSLLLVCAMICTMAVGCGKDNKTEEAKSGKDDKITIWAIWGGADTMAEPFKKAVKEVEKKYPDTEIEVSLTDNESYKTKIKSAVAANEAPDIYFTYGAGFNKPFVEADKNLDITDLISKETKDKLFPGALTNYTFDDKVYGLPTSQQVSRLFVNKELFEQNGV